MITFFGFERKSKFKSEYHKYDRFYTIVQFNRCLASMYFIYSEWTICKLLEFWIYSKFHHFHRSHRNIALIKAIHSIVCLVYRFILLKFWFDYLFFNWLKTIFHYIFQRPPVAFYIDNLEPGSSYRIILFAVNAKGRSEPTIIDDITFKGVAKYTGKTIRHKTNSNSRTRFKIGHYVSWKKNLEQLCTALIQIHPT